MSKRKRCMTDDQQRHYHRLLALGYEPEDAQRLAHGKWIGLGIRTNKTFMAGKDDGFGGDERSRRQAYAHAKRKGENINGKTWMPSLGAWIGSRDEAIRVAREKGIGCKIGTTTIQPREIVPEEKKPYQVAPDIVATEVERIVKEDLKGDVTPREKKQLTHQTAERLSGR